MSIVQILTVKLQCPVCKEVRDLSLLELNSLFLGASGAAAACGLIRWEIWLPRVSMKRIRLIEKPAKCRPVFCGTAPNFVHRIAPGIECLSCKECLQESVCQRHWV
jgi:hypothetical protein